MALKRIIVGSESCGKKFQPRKNARKNEFSSAK